ncbi:unnamed protein product [Orchesella dallaii]|uniref:Uncharacterized protein n=1 Tax=Orchesella dallaii TaxID=48710 RepID=A0ABP1S363_9HEXA
MLAVGSLYYAPRTILIIESSCGISLVLKKGIIGNVPGSKRLKRGYERGEGKEESISFYNLS